MTNKKHIISFLLSNIIIITPIASVILFISMLLAIDKTPHAEYVKEMKQISASSDSRDEYNAKIASMVIESSDIDKDKEIIVSGEKDESNRHDSSSDIQSENKETPEDLLTKDVSSSSKSIGGVSMPALVTNTPTPTQTVTISISVPTITPFSQAVVESSATPAPEQSVIEEKTSKVQVVVYQHMGDSDQAVYQAIVILKNGSTGEILGEGTTNSNGSSPEWNVAKNTNIQVYAYPPESYTTQYCGTKWETNTGPYGTSQRQNMRIQPLETNPCYRL